VIANALAGGTAVAAMTAVTWLGVPGAGRLFDAKPSASIAGVAFTVRDLRIGTVIACESHGIRIGAPVPEPGHSAGATIAGERGTAWISVAAERDGVVIVRCS
jgi:hypothetical protein